MEYYARVRNRDQLTSYLYKILNSSCAKLLASKFSLSSQKKVEKKYGNLQPLLALKPISGSALRPSSSGSRSLACAGVNLVEAINALDEVSKKRLNTVLNTVEIKRFISSSSSNGRCKVNSRSEFTCLPQGMPGHTSRERDGFNVKAYIAGFIDAEGNFFIKIVKSSTIKTGYAIQLSFGLILHVRELELLKLIQSPPLSSRRERGVPS